MIVTGGRSVAVGFGCSYQGLSIIAIELLEFERVRNGVVII